MTRYREKGQNEIATTARREAMRTGRDVCAVLRKMLVDAKAAGDSASVRKIIQAQKFLGCRNRRKRRK